MDSLTLLYDCKTKVLQRFFIAKNNKRKHRFLHVPRNMSFKEVRLIFECNLTQITTPDPDDFCTQEARDYIADAYQKASNYRKYVFGEVTHVWSKQE